MEPLSELDVYSNVHYEELPISPDRRPEVRFEDAQLRIWFRSSTGTELGRRNRTVFDRGRHPNDDGFYDLSEAEAGSSEMNAEVID